MAVRYERIAELMELAKVYMEDGAWFTAAARLDEASKLLREGQTELNAALETA